MRFNRVACTSNAKLMGTLQGSVPLVWHRSFAFRDELEQRSVDRVVERRSLVVGEHLLAQRRGAIFGASLAPYIATGLAKTYGLQYVGYYLLGAAVLTLIGLVASRETKDDVL